MKVMVVIVVKCGVVHVVTKYNILKSNRIMSKVNLKENIWIEGFDTEVLCLHNYLSIQNKHYPIDMCIYSGKTSEIPEELAKECAEIIELTDTKYLCVDYNGNSPCFLSAKQSIQSACQEEYCIIYKEE